MLINFFECYQTCQQILINGNICFWLDQTINSQVQENLKMSTENIQTYLVQIPTKAYFVGVPFRIYWLLEYQIVKTSRDKIMATFVRDQKRKNLRQGYTLLVSDTKMK